MKTAKVSSTILWITLMVVFYFPAYAYADAAPGLVAFPAGTEINFDSLISANGGRGGGEASAYYGTYPGGTQVLKLNNGVSFTLSSSSWSAFPSSVWTFNWLCTAPDSSHANCDYGTTVDAPWDFVINFGTVFGTSSSPIAGQYYILYYDSIDAPTGVYYPFYWNGSSPGSIAGDSSTRIIAVTPAASSTIATSTGATIGALVNVNASDYSSGMFVRVQYVYQANALLVVANTEVQFTTIDFPITAPGISTVSTTSPVLRVGRYTMITSIRQASTLDSVLNFTGFGQFASFGLKTSTTTTFVAGAANAYDRLTDSMVGAIDNYLASSTISLASCTNWAQLNLLDCMNLVFVPQWAPIKSAVDNFRNGFLTYFPWGYVTRFAVILSGSATTTLPTYSVNMDNVLPPGTVDGNYTLDMNDMLAGGAAALNNVTPRGGAGSLQGVAEPILRLFLALLIIITIIKDLTKIGAGHSSAARHGHV